MGTASDYTTLLQLSVAVNLAVDAYASRRKRAEEKIAEELDSARETMDRILSHAAGVDAPLDQGLERKPVKELTNRELSRYLGDVTIRFYRRAHRFRVLDKYMEPLLTPLGIVSLVALVAASLSPSTDVPSWTVWLGAAVLFAPPILAFVRATRDTRRHEHFHRREANVSYSKVVEAEHDRRMRTTAAKGEIFRVTNHIRVRHRSLNK